MRIPVVYIFMLWFCALFVISGCDDDEFVEEHLSEESKNIFQQFFSKSKNVNQQIPSDSQKAFIELVKRNGSNLQKNAETNAVAKAEDTIGFKAYAMFECAIQYMKGDSEDFYPKFADEEVTNRRRIRRYHKRTNVYYRRKGSFYSRFMNGTPLDDSRIPKELDDAIENSTFTDTHYQIDSKYRASRKLSKYFDVMYKFLTRFDQPEYAYFLYPQSYLNAKALVEKITTPDATSAENQTAIILFASSYARMRHWVKKFLHKCNQLIFLTKTVEYEKLKGRKAMLHEILDYVHMLRPLALSQNDVRYLNLVHQVIYPLKNLTDMYFSQSFEYRDMYYGQPINARLPFVKIESCSIPSVPRFPYKNSK